jgi:hypothetical protein
MDRWGIAYFRDNLSSDLKNNFRLFGLNLGDEEGKNCR